MELRHYASVLRRRALLIVLTTVVAAAVAGLATPRTPKYSATSVVYVGATKFSLGPNAGYTFDPTQLVDRLMKTYATMLDSEPIAADAIRTTQVPRTPKKVVKETTVAQQTGTQLLKITVVDRSALNAQRLANGISDAFISKVSGFEPTPGPGSVPALPAYIFQRADVPAHAESTGLIRNVAVVAFFALLLAVSIAFLLDRLDLTMRSRTEVEERLNLPVLGSIPYNSDNAAGVFVPIADASPAPPALHTTPTIGS